LYAVMRDGASTLPLSFLDLVPADGDGAFRISVGHPN
jgi:hypothetical protein